MKKRTSCGVVITEGSHVLACIPSGRDSKESHSLDLPKGGVEPGETPRDCVIRECWEETGFHLLPNLLTSETYFPYTDKKDLILFLYEVEYKFDLQQLFCKSVFKSKLGKEVPEHRGYLWVPFKDVKKRFYSTLGLCIHEFLKLNDLI